MTETGKVFRVMGLILAVHLSVNGIIGTFDDFWVKFVALFASGSLFYLSYPPATKR